MQIDFQKVSIEMAYKIAQLELDLTVEKHKVSMLLEELESQQNEKEE